MIIYRDIATESKDEIISDIFDIKDVGNGLWEADLKMITKGSENFVLEGANPSAEGEDADEGGAEGGDTRVLDLVDQFRLQKIEGLTKKAYTGDLKKYMKKVLDALKASGAPEEDIKAFQTGAQAAAKKILGNFDNYDIYQGESLDEGSMYVLVDFRDDGVTPYATVWRYGLEAYKV